MSYKIHIIDLNFLDETSSIASFLIETSEGLVLIESGPETTFDSLVDRLNELGFDWKQIKHLLLSHIHFDHAGAAWKFAQNGTKIYVHPSGLPHLKDPERLWNSAAMIYGDDMDRLWGKMEPIPESQLMAVDDGSEIKIGDTTFHVLYTPGHAVHHNAYLLDDIIFSGDAAGVKIADGPVVPPCPPPDINIELWKQSLRKMKSRSPEAIYLTHFGKVENVPKHFEELEFMLDDWSNWMKPFFDTATPLDEITPKFIRYTQNQLREAGVSDENMTRYEYANPSWMSVAGLMRYWKLKEQGRI